MRESISAEKHDSIVERKLKMIIKTISVNKNRPCPLSFFLPAMAKTGPNEVNVI